MTEESDRVEPDEEQEGEDTSVEVTEPEDEGDDDGDDSGEDQETFTREYVHELRDEAAAARVRAKRGETAEDWLRALVIQQTTSGILTDPTDLTWTSDLADEDGWPDAEKIEAAARKLVESKPHLGRPTGDVGQGQRGDDHDAVSLTDLLRSGV